VVLFARLCTFVQGIEKNWVTREKRSCKLRAACVYCGYPTSPEAVASAKGRRVEVDIMRASLAALIGLTLASAGIGWGYTINLLTYNQPYTLYNTGVDNFGNALSTGSSDPHYTDNNWAGSNATYVQRHTAWRSDITSGSGQVRWITPTNSVNGSNPGNVDAGTIYFYTNFTLPTDYPFWNVTMTAYVWADNDPNRISIMDGTTELAFVVPPQPLNNGECGYKGPGSSSSSCGTYDPYSGGPNTLSYNGLLGGRTYTIRFEVINKGNSPTPAGLWVGWESADATGVPEPSTYALMGTVGLALYLLRRRKKAAER